MKLKKITLDNIRSYENETIEFGEGSTLLSGDIGSGKTSILLGIEFGLFGLQPGQRGSAILRNGANTGGVEIEFEVEGKNVLIKRTMKRGKSVSQDYASISVDGEKEEISVTELKSRVLTLLNYPKEFSKKQNILYKFTVYTPQEEMKQIILQDSETRINTLRHVFGIDKYKRILENSSVVLAKIREEKKLKEGMTIGLEQDKLDLEIKEKDLDSKKQELLIAEGDLLLKVEQKNNSQKEVEEVSKQREEKLKLNQEIEKTKIMISTKNSSMVDNRKMIGNLKLQIEEMKQVDFDDSKISEIENEILQMNKKKQELNSSILDIQTKITSFSLKNQENEGIKQKLSHIEVCPTCLQDVNETYKNNVLSKLTKNTDDNVSQMDSLMMQKTKIQEAITKMEIDITIKQKEIQELNIQKIKLQGIQEKQSRIDEIERSNLSLSKDIEMLDKQLEILKSSVLELSKFDILFEEKQKLLLEAQRQEKLAEIKVAELKREIDVFSNQIEELKLRILKIEEIKKNLNYLADLEQWLNKKFVPVISHVEKNVMVKLKSEFSKLFAEWFLMLVSENFNIRLNDDFTPIIEQQDYEIDYNYLSGGERTAIALAYRLALNQVINSVISKIKTKDLVILDEPTDGFSEQQLDKMRSVLDELNVGQLIIVSHEQKIEGFVDNVIKFKKVNGLSQKE